MIYKQRLYVATQLLGHFPQSSWASDLDHLPTWNKTAAEAMHRHNLSCVSEGYTNWRRSRK